MRALGKTDEVILLTRVLECSPQPDGWSRVLDFIDTRLDCRSFLAEFDFSGQPTSNFGGYQPALLLGTLLRQIETEVGRNTLQYLLSEAPLGYPHGKAAPGLTKDGGGGRTDAPHEPHAAPDDFHALETGRTEPDQLELLRNSQGLVSPVWRTDRSTVLFACVFTGYTPGTVDGAIAHETFDTIVNALTRGLHTYFQLEKERARIESHSLFLSTFDNPAILINADRDILVHTPNGLEALVGLGVAAPRGAKLVFINKHIESGLQMLLAEAEVRRAAAEQNGHSVYIGDKNGILTRVSIETVVPAAQNSSREMTYVLIRVCEPADLPDDVEAVLQHHYDLSQSEAHLARHLTLSGSMNLTAAHLGITRNTAKTHLRRIYEKTGVHTQLQLAGLVHRLAGLF